MKTTPADKRAFERVNLQPRADGFSLVEVTLSLGIMAFCLTSVFSLLPIGISSNQDSITQTRAVSVAANVCADVRAIPLNLTTSPRCQVDTSTKGTRTLYFSEVGDNFRTEMDATSRYRADISVTPGMGQAATWVSVVVTWPPKSSTQKPGGGRYEGVTAINRF